MIKTKHLLIKRRSGRDGIKVHDIRYKSPLLQRLREQFDMASVRIHPDSEDIRYVHVWHLFRCAWIKVAFVKSERLATEGKNDELAFILYPRAS